MHKTIATVAAIVAGMAALGGMAATAGADVPNPIYTQSLPGNGAAPPSGTKYWKQCQTPQSRGVLGQYGAWGYYIDGCTVALSCPPNRVCLMSSTTRIGLLIHRGDRVTQNAKLRRFDASGQVFGWTDRSCAGINTCSTGDYVYLNGGESASIQCNGVREAKPLGNDAVNSCRLESTLVS